MSIYVLRSDNLIKIGFSDDLRKRVGAIISTVPVPVEFVGHMPGDREVEAHLHERFASTRFSGEWFVETPEMRVAFDALLTPNMPEQEAKPQAARRIAAGVDIASMSQQVRDKAADTYPRLSASERIDQIAKDLGWTRNRVKDLFYADSRIALRSMEMVELNGWLALAIAPELRGE